MFKENREFSDYIFEDVEINEDEPVYDEEHRAALEEFYGRLTGCPNKEFKYLDKNHWYIRID